MTQGSIKNVIVLYPFSLLESDMSYRCSLKLLEVSASSEYLSQVTRDRANIGTVRDLYVTDECWPGIGNNLKGMNGSLFWRYFSSVVSFSRELVGSLSINPDGTIHGRGL